MALPNFVRPTAWTILASHLWAAMPLDALLRRFRRGTESRVQVQKWLVNRAEVILNRIGLGAASTAPRTRSGRTRCRCNLDQRSVIVVEA